MHGSLNVEASAVGLSSLLSAVRRLEAWFGGLEENEVPKGYITLMQAGGVWPS